jgi:SAM-dependent methyltransferase
MKFRSYIDSLEYIKKLTYKTNEYFIKGKFVGLPSQKIETRAINTLFSEGLIISQKDFGNYQARSVVTKEAITRFHPNNIDNKNFWIQCRKHFPLLSVSGGICKNIKEVNEKTLKLSKDIGAYRFLRKILKEAKEKLNILEIGCGYGGLFNIIKDKCTYYGIDYVIHQSLKKYKKNFIEIDVSGIPDYLQIDNFFDIIYCVNVLQHCSQKDRFEYFKQGHKILKKGGYFIFTVFLMNEENKEDNCWGVIDEKGIGYTHFFNQLTECDWNYELYLYLEEIGFEPIESKIVGNFAYFTVKKL